MKKFKLTLRHRETVAGYAFISLWLIGIFLFFGRNLVLSVYYSFCNVVPVSEKGYIVEFIGLLNYRFAFLQHATFNRLLAESMLNMVIDVPLIIFFSLFVAIALNRKFKLRGAVRAIFFLPVLMTSPAITEAIATSLRNVMGGPNTVTIIENATQTSATSTFNVALVFQTLAEFNVPLSVIQYITGAIGRVYEVINASGVQILIFLAALQSISTSLYEVAHIEGATAYETFWKVTFPMVSPLILTNVVYTIIDSYTSSVVATTINTVAFDEMNFGLSSTMAVSSALSVSLLLLVSGWFISRKVFYHT